MKPGKLAILADDLSGAADCAASFTGAAGPVRLFLHADGGARDRTFALDCDSRWRDAASAARIWERAAGELAPDGALVYKKIDSTLRGHIGVELGAMLRRLPQIRAVVVAPAFPAQGRTLVGGRLRVHGEALATPGEALAQTLARALGGCDVVPVPVEALDTLRWRDEPRIGSSRPRVLVADALEEADLATLAGAALAASVPPLFVGSSGLARAIARVAPRHAAREPRAGPALIVVGSFSATAHAQVDAFAARTAGDVIAVRPGGDATNDAAALALRALEHGTHALVHFAFGEPPRAGSRSLVRSLAAALRPAARACGTLVLTGGDTARAVLEALEVDSLLVEGEAEPGIAVCAPFAAKSARVILKAGGFGDNDVLVRLATSARSGQPLTPADR